MNRVAENQARIFLRLLQGLRPHWQRDRALPERFQRLLAEHPSFGARDRRLYRELVFTTLRYLPWIEPLLDAQTDEAVRLVAWVAAETKATQAFRAAFATGTPPAGDKSALLPAWFREHCPSIFSGVELETQLTRAPLWLRIQPEERAAIDTEFSARGWTITPSAVLPGAVRVTTDVDVTRTDSFQDGFFEVQDLGSQMLLAAAPVAPGDRWLDACAGAGGKSLQLARLLGPRGRVDAHDIRPLALHELQLRARRAGANNIHVIAHPSPDGYDGVLVDAPCSGSGTWRRAPHLKWCTRPEDIAHQAGRQLALLTEFSAQVAPGGLLVYATCSLSRMENEDVAAAFLAANSGFAPAPLRERFGFSGEGHTLTILPARHDTDGYFVAAFRRTRTARRSRASRPPRAGLRALAE